MEASALFVFILGVIFVVFSILACLWGRKISRRFLEREARNLIMLFTIFLSAALMIIALLLFQLSLEKVKGDREFFPALKTHQIDV